MEGIEQSVNKHDFIVEHVKLNPIKCGTNSVLSGALTGVKLGGWRGGGNT